ncbi:SGNH family hydrolase [Bradyrhizobium sp. BEA-2-5]|uniref:SGNH/GDSL hydrolase family protein n=1 Tax=Bradyrhizobium sp. BEA-2-5 TaxID=3080015 RepID=UPI00293EA46C|nr:SGNH family hydrolase [Bradyrhizobium sp. BEA-2-5]WOH81048.1 SGNH family hydrolase [Bradyrhizobium sp. BEA-2-5]
MREPKSFLRIFTEAGPLVALTVTLALLIGIAQPASAQFFGFPGFGGGPPQPQRRAPPQHGGGGWFGGDFFAPFQQQQPQSSQPQRPREDFSRAPAPAKREAAAERNVLVIGDAMADWLAYGLEDAYSEQPDMGVIRKHKTVSGLIRYQPKGDPADWAAAAKGILATENPDAIVVMLGLNDRTAIRESVVEKKVDKKDEKKDARGKPEAKPGDKPDAAAKNDGKAEAKPADPELPADDADNDQPAAPEKTARNPNGLYEFRDDRWVELYGKKIEELANILKAKGVPVLWVGLPAVRGTKGTADTLFLDSLYREGAAKAGITYVDVWDGFVDEAGRFLQKGPDFEGQIRQLRSSDGVYFTKAGARKLAHYVEREITRLLAARSGPIALPSEPATPDTSAEPGKPAPRPLAGPVLPLVASTVGTDQLLGGPGSRPAAVDALAARTLVKGEALAPPAGRADDFVWPRREMGREQAKGDVPVAATTPAAPAGGPANPPPSTTAIAPDGSIITAPKPPRRAFRPAQTQAQPQQQQPQTQPWLRDLFGFGAPQQRPLVAPPPRPPRGVGQRAAVPGNPWQ